MSSKIPEYILRQIDAEVADNPEVDCWQLAKRMFDATSVDDVRLLVTSLYSQHIRNVVTDNLCRPAPVVRERPVVQVSNAPARARTRHLEMQAMIEARRAVTIAQKVAVFIPLENETVQVDNLTPVRWIDMTEEDVEKRRNMISRQIRGLSETDDLLREAAVLFREVRGEPGYENVRTLGDILSRSDGGQGVAAA